MAVIRPVYGTMFDIILIDIIHVLKDKITPIYLPILTVLGLVGNLITIVTIYHNVSLRRASANQYLAAVSISDSLFLLGVVPGQLHSLRLWQRARHPTMICQLQLFIVNTASCVSSWAITAMAIERYFVITRWVKAGDIAGSVLRTVIIILCLIPVPVALNMHVFFIAGIENNYGATYCSYLAEYAQSAMYLSVIDTIVVFVIPSIIVGGVNFSVMMYTRRMNRQDKSNAQALLRINQRCKQRLKQQTHLTTVLLIVPVAFILLNAPSYILRLINYGLTIKEAKMPLWLVPFLHIALLMHYSNFGVNLLTYTLASSKFRAALLYNVYYMRMCLFKIPIPARHLSKSSGRALRSRLLSLRSKKWSENMSKAVIVNCDSRSRNSDNADKREMATNGDQLQRRMSKSLNMLDLVTDIDEYLINDYQL